MRIDDARTAWRVARHAFDDARVAHRQGRISDDALEQYRRELRAAERDLYDAQGPAEADW